MAARKEILMIAGPNGAGKTTFAAEYLLNEAGCPDFLNADSLAVRFGLGPSQAFAAAVLAGHLPVDGINSRVAVGKSFALETTLSGRGYARDPLQLLLDRNPKKANIAGIQSLIQQ